jgi:hypothetical protein
MLQVPARDPFNKYGDESQAVVRCQVPASCQEVSHMRGARLIQLTFLLAFALAFPVRFLAQVPTDNVLTNADIVKMTKAGLSESIIQREIQLSRIDFSTSPAALIELKKHGVSESVLGAILDSRLGTSRSAADSQPIPYIPQHTATPGPHHLPSFEADIRLDSKTHEKLSVGPVCVDLATDP